MNPEAEQVLTAHREPHDVMDYMYNHNVIAFIVIVLAIITAAFWFEFFRIIVRNIIGDNPTLLTVLLVALFWTLVFIVIDIMIFKIPVAASFAL